MLVQKVLKNAYIWIPNPTSIVLDKSSISLTTIWQTEQLTATLTPDVCDQRITWTTSDSTVATVSTTGLVTCVTPWTCTITATTVNGLTATCGVTDQWWQPTVNTIAWYPLNSTTTVNDASWNGHNWTLNWNITYDSISATFTPQNFIDIPTIIPYWTNPFSISVWWYYQSWWGCIFFQQFNSSTGNSAIQLWAWWWTCSSWSKWSNDWNNITPVSDSVWNNFVLTYDGSSLKLYLNWTLKWTKTRTISTATPNYWWIGKGWETYWPWYSDWKISNLIIEDKTRTAQEVADYYDLTKYLYGIS